MNIGSLLQGIAAFAWLAALAALGFVVFNITRGRKLGGGAPIIVGAVVLALLLTTVASGLVFINPEERGVVISALVQGAATRPNVLTPGLHWIIPFAERVQAYSVARKTYTMSSSATEGSVAGDDSVQARTKDGQQISIDVSVIYAIDENKILDLNVHWQNRYENEVVRPLARSIIRDVASTYGVEEIVSTKRADMETAITNQLKDSLASHDLVLDDFVMRDLRFSTQYAAAVEQKQVAQQQAEEAALVVETKKQEAEQARVTAQGQADAAVISAQGKAQATVLQAQADSQALTLVGDVLKGHPDVLTFRYIDKLAPNVQVMYLPSGNPYLVALPTPSGTVPVVPTPTGTLSSTAPITATTPTTSTTTTK